MQRKARAKGEKSEWWGENNRLDAVIERLRRKNVRRCKEREKAEGAGRGR